MIKQIDYHVSQRRADERMMYEEQGRPSTTSAPTGQPALSTLLTGIFDDTTRLLRQEIQLARVELGRKLQTATSSIIQLLSGALFAYVGLVALVIVGILALVHVLPAWAAAVIMGVVVMGIGATLIQLGRSQLRNFAVIPQQAVASTQAEAKHVGAQLGITRAPASSPTEERPVRAQKGKRDYGAEHSDGSLWQIIKTTVKEWTEDEASLLAAALSYYTAISLAPLLVLVVVIVGLFLSQDAAREQVMGQLQGAIGNEGAQFLELILANADQPQVASLAGILSFLTLLWGSTNVFSQLQNSLNKIWDVEPKPGRSFWMTLKDRLLSFGMVLGVAFLLLVSFIISAVLSALGTFGQSWLPGIDWIWQVVNFAVSLGVITLLFAAIYKVLPDAEIAWRHVWIGAAVTALLFTVGKTLLGWYLANAGSAYGAAGSLIVFLLWVYYSAQILFFGAEFTQVYARNHGQGIQPSAGAQRIGARPA